MKKYPYVILGVLCAVSFIVGYVMINRRKRLHDWRSKEYKMEVYNNTPIEYQNNIGGLHHRLGQLDEIIDRTSKSLNVQFAQAVDDILKKTTDAEREINEYWELNRRKEDFHYYIGLHYTSFTLANKLTEELETLKKVKEMLNGMIKTPKKRLIC